MPHGHSKAATAKSTDTLLWAGWNSTWPAVLLQREMLMSFSSCTRSSDGQFRASK
jgi:hypothetical protein